MALDINSASELEEYFLNDSHLLAAELYLHDDQISIVDGLVQGAYRKGQHAKFLAFSSVRTELMDLQMAYFGEYVSSRLSLAIIQSVRSQFEDLFGVYRAVLLRLELQKGFTFDLALKILREAESDFQDMVRRGVPISAVLLRTKERLNELDVSANDLTTTA